MTEKYNQCTQEEINIKFSQACFEGNFEEVKFFLIDSILKKKADIHYNDDEPIQYAINSGNLKVIDYLLKSPDLKKKANIHASDELSFKYAVFKKNMDVLQYLIFDFGIEKTISIEKILSNPDNSSLPLDVNTVEQVKKMFDMRELKVSLQGDLSNNSINKQKTKI